MNNKWLTSVACLVTYLVSITVYAETQEIVPSKTSFQAASGDIVEFDLNYSSASPDQTTGLGLKLNYDSRKLTLIDISDVFTKAKLAQATGVKKVSKGNAKSKTTDPTDKTINVAWASLNGKWPGTEKAETKLLKVKFKMIDDFTSPTTISFTGNASAGNTFSATPVEITPINKTIVLANTETSNSQSPATTVLTSSSSSSGGGSVSWLILSFLLLLGVVNKGLGRKTNLNQIQLQLNIFAVTTSSSCLYRNNKPCVMLPLSY